MLCIPLVVVTRLKTGSLFVITSTQACTRSLRRLYSREKIRCLGRLCSPSVLPERTEVFAFCNGSCGCENWCSHFVVAGVTKVSIIYERFCIIVVRSFFNLQLVAWKSASAVTVVRRPCFGIRMFAVRHFVNDFCCMVRGRFSFATAAHGVEFV